MNQSTSIHATTAVSDSVSPDSISSDFAFSDSASSDCRIVVAGLGGVGGFLGAALASVYPNVTFFARGARKDFLKANGLTLQSEFIGNRQVFPALVTDQVSEIETADILIISVKNYSLEQICEELSPIVDAHTIIVPVLNGTDPGDRTRQTFGKGIVVDSLIYIISESRPDFTIVQKGDYATLRIGTRSDKPEIQAAVQTIHRLLEPTGVTCIVEEDIEAAIWKKYIFNCAYNIMTAAYSADVQDLHAKPEYITDMETLINEACLVARCKQISILDDFTEERMHFFLNLQSPTGTSSLRRDIDAGRPCELETFSGALLQEAAKCGLELPRTHYYYELLKKKTAAVSNPQNTAANIGQTMQVPRTELEVLLNELQLSTQKNGISHEETASCHYRLGLYYINHGNAMEAMNHLGDALYIRRKFYPEESLKIREIYYALEQCTFM